MPSLMYVATVSHTIRHFLLPYAAHFRGLGWRVTAAGSDASLDPTLGDAFDDVFDIPLSRSIRDVRGMARGGRALSAALATHPDIVHVHTPIAAFITRFVVRRMPASERPLVAYTAHGFHFHRGGKWTTNFAFRTAEQIAGRWTDRLIVINDEDFAAARKHRIVPAARLVLMPGIGIDTDLYSPVAVPAGLRDDARARLGLPASTPYFTLVGELNRNKRSSDVLGALARMRRRDARLVLLGEGAEREALEERAATLGIADRVTFGGYVSDVRPIVAGGVANILVSQREGLARSVMEALALEVPVIASTARGNRELVSTDSGFIVPTGDVDELASRMDWIVDHPDEARGLGRRGRERMVASYDLRELIRQHEALYLTMLAERDRVSTV